MIGGYAYKWQQPMIIATIKFEDNNNKHLKILLL